MNRKKFSEIDEKLLDKIISVAYGDANYWDRMVVSNLSKKNPDVKRILSEYNRTAESIHLIKPDECPEEIFQNIQYARDISQKNNRSFINDIYLVLFKKPIASAAVASLIILAVISTLILERPESWNGYTQEEIEFANKQVLESFSIVGNVFHKAQNTIEKEVLATRVGAPLREGINIVNNLFTKENKNEKSN